ncbi:hypothetical protein [uncultured Parasphingorhabdus sp.]|uniref:hypothetical protein n=1 Tax=uncultured Parasphingorhabdus sp. TaxID=2709694 RepID=UPI002AA70399|nr:hypothetical protein [uncultured Parasphingorhabdus sp.]
MRIRKLVSGLSASSIAITMAATPVSAQDAGTQQTQSSADIDIARDGELSNDEKTLIVAGAVGVVGKQFIKPTKHISETAKMVGEAGRKKAASNVRQLPTSTNIAGQNLRQTATATRPTSLRELRTRATAARTNRIAGSADALAEMEQRGNAAKHARTRPGVTNAAKPRPANMANSELGRVIQNGENAQAARAGAKKPSAANRGGARKVTFRDQVTGKPNPSIKTQPKPAAVRPVNIADSDLGRVIKNGENARAARVTRVAGSANELADLGRRGDAARNARNVAKAGQGSQQLGRQILANSDDLGGALRRGDIAQQARRLAPANEAQVVRNVAASGGDISKLNKAGRTAQVARGAGGLKAASTTADAAKMARAAKLAKTAKTAGTVGKLGKGGRALLAGTGVGAVAVVAEMAAVEGIKATTGVEVQDPLSTGFQYGAAIFDKDVSIADVAAQRREHHRENFRNLTETLTTEGKLMDNITKYADSKNPALGNGVRMLDRLDRQRRALLEEHTGIKTERRMDVVARYGDSLKKHGLEGVATVAGERAKHHVDNARALGATSRSMVGNATGADLRSIRETQNRYAEAATSDKPIAAVAEVAKQRAQHHTNNVKKVGSKVACGIGNIFRSKSKDKDCKK